MKHTEFTAEFFIQNRRRLIQAAGDDLPIILVGNGLMQRNSDNTYPFRQDSSFWYLTGCEEPNAWAILYGGTSTLVLPERQEVHIIFDGQADPRILLKTTGLDKVLLENDGWQLLKKIFREYKMFGTLAPDQDYDADHGMFRNGARNRILSKINKDFPDVSYKDLRLALMEMRFIKQQPEINAIRKAVAVTTKAVAHIERNVNNYRYEYDIEADLIHLFKKSGLDHAYPPIIASGKNSCTMHYFQNNQPLIDGNIVLLDVGAEYSHYSADISRTIVFGNTSKRQQAVIHAVAEAAEYGTNLLKPGISFIDCQMEMYQFIGEKLKELGLIKKITKKNIMQYNPTASHFLGLDVHDVGDYHRPLEPGVVLTIEPGIYIPEENIGVRIEDDVLITENGCEVLSKQLPKHFLTD